MATKYLTVMFEHTKIAKVFEACEGSGCDGYLVARIGDRVEVLYYESSAEGDWVYARNAVHQSRLGWMPASALQPPKETWLQLGATVCTTKVLRPAAGRGYLCADVGDHLQVLYIGGKATEDEGWLYACRLTALREDSVNYKGWVEENAVQPVTWETGGRSAPIDDLAHVVEPNITTAILNPSPMRSPTTLNVESLPEVHVAAQATTVASHLHSAFSFKPRIQYSATGHTSARTMLLLHPRRHGNPEVALLSSQACTLVGIRGMESLRPNTELDLRHSHLTCLPESIGQLALL